MPLTMGRTISHLRGGAFVLLALLLQACNRVDVGGGERLYRKRTCWRCHGVDRSGTEMGPPLTGVADHWDLDRLTAYIADPAPFREKDPRLKELVSRYHGRLMKGISVRREERKALAEWLLDSSSRGAGRP